MDRFAVVLVLSILSVQPVAAWGVITHVKMSAEGGIPVPGFRMEFFSGSIAPDAGYLISTNWGNKFHGNDVSKAKEIARRMMELASSTAEREFARGWFAHLMQDRVAHGTGRGLPNDPEFGPGYSNYAQEKYGIDHIEAEFYVDGRVFYEKGWGLNLVRLSIPVELVKKTMDVVYSSNNDLSTEDIATAYDKAAMMFFGELACFLGIRQRISCISVP